MAKVFLSYSREDIECVRQLAELLGEGGHDVWWDQHIQGGSRFSAAIDDALKDAQAVVVIWSVNSVRSAWVQDEAGEGRDSGRLVPVVIGNCKPPLGFRQFQAVDLSGWRGGDGPQVQALLAAIESTAAPAAAEPGRNAKTEAASGSEFSICVLPFVNMSGEPEQDYFSDGISEDIITDLSNVSALSVVARNTSFTFKGQTVDVKEIAEKLGVTHVLEGSVRKAGNRVRITGQLIDGAKGDHVWAARYDRDLTDIFAIQDEISKAIVEALKVKLLPGEKKKIEQRGTSNVEAYDLYLMARQQWISGTFGTVRREQSINRLCRQATVLDPEYAHAWALMGLAQLELRFVHGHDEDALSSAERALEINPGLAEAHCIKARYLEEEGQATDAETQIRTALRLDPDSWEVNREAARMLFRHGQAGDAIPFFQKAASLNDTDWHNPVMLITCFLAIGDQERMMKAAEVARDRVQRAVSADPTNGTALASGAYALAMLGDVDRSREWMRRALLLDPDNLAMKYNAACTFLSQLGDPEEALKTLEPFFQGVTSATWVWHAEADPDLEPIRSEPKFQKMLGSAKQRLGMEA